MISISPYTLALRDSVNTELLHKNSWLVMLHASRIPPHIGILINGNYYSLTIKGHELDISIQALLKTIQLKKIESVFIELVKQPVFSFDFQQEICRHYIKQFEQVRVNHATCLSPIKLFLAEFYALPVLEDELFFQLLERLKQNNYIADAFGLNINFTEKTNEFVLPMYNVAQLQKIITTERLPYYND